MRSSAVKKVLKWRIYADNRHLAFSDLFPCALIFLYAQTGEKSEWHTQHIWQPICTLCFLTTNSSTRFRVLETAFSDFSVCRLNVTAKINLKSQRNVLIKNCDSGICKIGLSVWKGCHSTRIREAERNQ